MKKALLICIFAVVGLSAASFAHAAVLSKAPNNLGLVGYWSFNEGTGNKAGDSSGHGYASTISGASWVDGKRGKALSFNGSGDNGYVPTVDLSGTNVITVTFWMNWTAFANNDKLAMEFSDNYNNSTGGFLIDPNSNANGDSKFEFALRGNNGISAAHFTRPSAGVMHFYSFIFDKSLASNEANAAYVDGISQSVTYPTYNNNNTNNFGNLPLFLMSRNFNNLNGAGILDEVRIYSRALSATEIQSLYQSGSVKIKAASDTGLVGYWSLNEGTGNKAGDSSGNNFSGTLSGGSLPAWIDGKHGKALNFDGSANYVTLGSRTLGYKNLTVSTWMKYGGGGSCGIGAQSYQGLVSKNVFTDFILAYTCSASNGGAVGDIVFWAENGSGTPTGNIYSNTLVNDGKWHMVTGTCNGTICSLYVDGVFQNSADLSGDVADHSAETVFGAYSDLSRYFNGSIDDARIYSRALSQAEVQGLYQSGSAKIASSQNNKLTTGLVGLWSFDGPDLNWASNTAYDRSGIGNNGTMAGLDKVSSVTGGKIGQALDFNGSSSIISLGTGSNMSAFTLSAWIKPDAMSSLKAIISKSKVYEMDISGSNTILGAIGDGSGWSGPFAYSGQTYTNGVWSHVAMVYNGSSLIIYLNGVPGTPVSPGVSPPGSSPRPVDLGNCGDCGVSYEYDGVLDDVRIYNRALSAAEVKQLYLIGK